MKRLEVVETHLLNFDALKSYEEASKQIMFNVYIYI
jgi:hypothetical protein